MQYIIKIILAGIYMFSFVEIHASRFDSSWRGCENLMGNANCRDFDKKCTDSGERIVDGIRLNKPCWKYGYKKICDFPSRNNCQKIAHCYDYGCVDCMVYDSLGNCVNEKKRFVCKEWNFKPIQRERSKQELKGDESKKIVCKGIPCIDGNCVDKSYNMDADMMESVSQLYSVSQMKEIGSMMSNIFPGTHNYCRKKPNGTMNCCKGAGWLKQLGAGCSSDEQILHKKRAKNLCIGLDPPQKSGTKPFHVTKHHFCCFGNLFTKVFQMQARKQLGKNFGSGKSPDCKGIALQEIVKLDFEKMDFSEFAHEVQKNMKLPNIGDLESRINDRFTELSVENQSINDEY
jgi:conjugal transfer mating pair stabilization protein TraN